MPCHYHSHITYSMKHSCSWEANISSTSQDISKILWTPSALPTKNCMILFVEQHISCKCILILTTLNITTWVSKAYECLLCNKICSHTPSTFDSLLKNIYVPLTCSQKPAFVPTYARWIQSMPWHHVSLRSDWYYPPIQVASLLPGFPFYHLYMPHGWSISLYEIWSP